MKIAFIGQKGIPAKIGGVERHVEELAKGLVAKGHEVFVYARRNYTDENLKEYKGIKIINLPSIPTKHLDAISHTVLATIYALFQKYDIIHFQSIGPSFLSFLVKIFNKKTGLVSTYHCQDYFHQKWSWFAKRCLKFGEYMACKVPDRTIAVSKILTSLIKNQFEKNAVYIPNGFNILRTDRQDEIKKLGLEKNGYILSVSRLIKHKGIHYLIEAFKKLEDKNLTKGKKLVIVGEGFYTSRYIAYLKKISADRKNIIFTGSKNGETLAQLFENAYLFVQPSQSEGLSITLLEAMGYGKGILVSDIPENMEAVSSAGFSFENGNIKDLTLKMEYLVKNPELIEASGRKAKEIADEKYDWNKIINKTEELYKNLMTSKKLWKKYLKFQNSGFWEL